MSIIYDALKKVEGKFKGADKFNPEVKTIEKEKATPKIYFTYLLVIGIGLLSASIFYKFFTPAFKISSIEYKMPVTPVKNEPTNLLQASNKVASSEGMPQVQPEKTAVPENNLTGLSESQKPPKPPQENLPSLVLNGIFFSGNDGYALINNKIVKIGDNIEGVIVTEINSNEVVLKTKDSTIKLSTKSR